MNKGMSIALLAAGVLLIAWGVSAHESVSSEVSRFFTGAPTDKAVWLLVSGAVASLLGLFGLMRGTKGN